jgi:hypothetical protein
VPKYKAVENNQRDKSCKNQELRPDDENLPHTSPPTAYRDCCSPHKTNSPEFNGGACDLCHRLNQKCIERREPRVSRSIPTPSRSPQISDSDLRARHRAYRILQSVARFRSTCFT